MGDIVSRSGWNVLAITVSFALTAGAEAAPPTGSLAASPDGVVLVPPVYDPQHYGAGAIVQTVRIEDFFPPDSTVTWSSIINSTSIYRYQTLAMPKDWVAALFLPSGAVIDSVEMEACDTTATGQILFGIARMVAPNGPSGNVSATGTTGVSATPGCAFFSVPSQTIVVDNRNTSLVLYVNWGGNPTPETRVSAFRVFYHLFVSAGPAVATFPNDVPTSHPLFRFVEALAASGVTAGCGPGAFCPDAPLTRGQMAVFLSVALGLHFPN